MDGRGGAEAGRDLSFGRGDLREAGADGGLVGEEHRREIDERRVVARLGDEELLGADRGQLDLWVNECEGMCGV